MALNCRIFKTNQFEHINPSFIPSVKEGFSFINSADNNSIRFPVQEPERKVRIN
jgi:hypothetical protein